MNWQLQHFDDTYGVNTSATQSCVLISGWSMNSDIFDWLMPGLAQYFQVYLADYKQLSEKIEDAVDKLAEQFHFSQPALIIGWSLGGNIALELAARHPDKVAGLCLLACSPSFIARDGWPHGMPEETFLQFQQGLLDNTDKTLRRFDLLQIKGDQQQNPLNKALQDYRKQQTAWTQADLQRGLQWLRDLDQRHLISQLRQRQLWCFGDNDRLVSATTANAVQVLKPQAAITLIEHSGHLPFLNKPDQIFTALLKTMLSDDASNKQKIANAFSKAAASYDNAASIQNWAAKHLLDKIDTVANTSLFADIGCGTGKNTLQLAQKTAVIGIDLAHGMLTYAQQQYPQQQWLNADAEQLPLTDNSLDGIYSNLAAQWSQHPSTLLQEWYRCLKPGACIWLSTLGNKTLFELRNSFAKTDNEAHVNLFTSIDQWRHYAQLAGLQVVSAELIPRIDYYADLYRLLRSLKNIGAQTVLYRQTPKTMSKKRWQTLQQAYEHYRHPQGLPATYELLFLCLQKPYV